MVEIGCLLANAWFEKVRACGLVWGIFDLQSRESFFIGLNICVLVWVWEKKVAVLNMDDCGG